jgi:hypothetical protein
LVIVDQLHHPLSICHVGLTTCQCSKEIRRHTKLFAQSVSLIAQQRVWQSVFGLEFLVKMCGTGMRKDTNHTYTTISVQGGAKKTLK